MFTLNCKGRLLSLGSPVVMGIINVNENSFYEDSRKITLPAVVKTAGEMLAAGAGILDLGGQSTHPKSPEVSAAKEQNRVIPAIEAILTKYPEAILSIDTYFSSVAEAAVKAGALIVNDISAGRIDPEMLAAVATLGVPYVAMHMQGTPATMQSHLQYEDVFISVMDYFIERLASCEKAGIKDIVIDPGFGFSKNQQQNYQLLSRLQDFTLLGRPILVGVSRKSMIYKALGLTAGEALNGSTVLHTFALQHGADILRVHDVQAAVEAIKLLNLLEPSYSLQQC
ncbi:MAG TPA: dihydropteroate synthase [Arachidicoccus sp.]|nr:dihydropteroate synthase [Arachidicoccus sp.]